MKILITGGAGFVGSHLVDELVNGKNEENKNEVIIYDNLEPQVHTNGEKPKYMNNNAEFIHGDIRDKYKLRELICGSGIEIIFHNAAMVGSTQSMYQIDKYVDINTIGTAKLLDILVNQEHNVKKLIVASSISIYGEGKYKCSYCGVVYPNLRDKKQIEKRKEGRWELKCPICDKIVKPLPTDEDKPLRPPSIYAISKRDQEEMCLSVGKMFGIPTVALRYCNIFGPRQSLNNPYTGVCAIFSSQIKNNNSPMVFEDGLQTRDFISVHDIVRSNLLVMKSSKANYNVYNVGTGEPISILDIANYLCTLYGERNGDRNRNGGKGIGELILPFVTNKYRQGDIRHCYADISKIKKLGFEPSISFEDGMKELVEWGENENADDNTMVAYQELVEKELV